MLTIIDNNKVNKKTQFCVLKIQITIYLLLPLPKPLQEGLPKPDNREQITDNNISTTTTQIAYPKISDYKLRH